MPKNEDEPDDLPLAYNKTHYGYKNPLCLRMMAVVKFESKDVLQW
jgi:hypothetical protein